MQPPTEPDNRQRELLDRSANLIERRYSEPNREIKVTSEQVWRGMLGLAFAQRQGFGLRRVRWNADTFAVHYIDYERYRENLEFDRVPLSSVDYFVAHGLGLFGGSVVSFQQLFPSVHWGWMEDPALALLISKLRAKARTADQIAEENNILVNQLEKQSTAARESIAELNTRLKEAEQKGNAEDVPRDTTGLEYVQVHADLARKKERISQLKEDLRVFRDKLLIREASLERNKERLKLAQEALQKRNSDVDSTSAERALQQKVDEAEQGRKKYIDEIEYRKERYRQVEIRLSTEEVARKNADDKAARLLNELSVSKDSIAAAEQKNATVSKLLSSCREKLKRAENGKRSAEEQASRLSDKLSQSEEEELRLTSVKTAAEAKIIELRNELSAAEKRVSKGPTPQTKKKITALEELVKDTDLTIAELTGALYASLSHLPRKNFKVQIETLRNHTLCRYESSRNKSEDAVVRHERFNKSIKIAEDISAYLTLIGENGDIEGEDWSISAGNKRKRVD